MDDPAFRAEIDVQTQSVLLAAANHDIRALRNLLSDSSANLQDNETGFTPLHAAIAACESDIHEGANEMENKANETTNGIIDDAIEQEQQVTAAVITTIQLLFEKGAIWNHVDARGETAGCIALRLGQEELYDLCVDAGVRAELLLNRRHEYEALNDVEDDRREEEKIDSLTINQDADGDEPTGHLTHLASALTLGRDGILDDRVDSVMASWKTAVMRKSAELLLPCNGLRVLNIGHGMSIVDEIFQEKQPRSHHIVETHPDAASHMKEQEWHERPGVVIHNGRWQDIIPSLLDKGEMFDAIYFDACAKGYEPLRKFFTECVIGLLDPAGGPDGEGGRFGFFNRIGTDRQVVYDVHNKVVEIDLNEAGFDVEWDTIPVSDLDERNKEDEMGRMCWDLKNYKLPICRFFD